MQMSELDAGMLNVSWTSEYASYDKWPVSEYAIYDKWVLHVSWSIEHASFDGVSMEAFAMNRRSRRLVVGSRR